MPTLAEAVKLINILCEKVDKLEKAREAGNILRNANYEWHVQEMKKLKDRNAELHERLDRQNARIVKLEKKSDG